MLRYIFLLLLSCSLLASSEPGQLLPLTEHDLEKHVEKIEERVGAALKKIASIPIQKKSFHNTLREWNRLGSDLLEDLGMLLYLSEADFPTQMRAREAVGRLRAFLNSAVVQNREIARSLFSYARKVMIEKESPYSAYENYIISGWIRSVEPLVATLSLDEQKEFDAVKRRSEEREKRPYIYLTGNLKKQLQPTKERELTLFSLNTCFLPGNMAYLYGGVGPWKERIQPLAAKIQAIDADLVCLQEIFTDDAAFELYHALRNHYSHFYMSVGPKPLGFDIASLGLPSGLFVASKYPLDNPIFTPFSASASQINYGFFDFVVKGENRPLGHIYITHLQAFNRPGFLETRKLQLNEIVQKIERDRCQEGDVMPTILCGDLNIPWGSEEPAEALLKTHFDDSYNMGRIGVSESSSTCTDYFTQHFLASQRESGDVQPHFQIIDYALLLKSDASRYQLETQIVPTSNRRQPVSALSDHHGLLTRLSESLLLE